MRWILLVAAALLALPIAPATAGDAEIAALRAIMGKAEAAYAGVMGKLARS